MREIKFRGLRTDGKGWVYGYYRAVNVIEGKKHLISDWFGNEVEVTSGSVGQFTGLKDKNGVEIYSNGRVRWFDASGITIGVVKWDNDKSAYVVYVDDYNEHYLYDVHYAYLEVIGNIHESEVSNG